MERVGKMVRMSEDDVDERQICEVMLRDSENKGKLELEKEEKRDVRK